MSVTLIDPYRFVVFDSDYELVTTTVLTTDTASVTFGSLGDYSSTYKHLQIRITGRTDRALAVDSAMLRFNSDTGSNYIRHWLTGNGSSASSSAETGQTRMFVARLAGDTASASIFGAGVVDILDPYSSNKNTTVRSLTGNYATGFTEIYLFSGLWNSTASITSIDLTPNIGSNFKTGSRFSLYGIK
jgi:hypothetical protein